MKFKQVLREVPLDKKHHFNCLVRLENGNEKWQVLTKSEVLMIQMLTWLDTVVDQRLLIQIFSKVKEIVDANSREYMNRIKELLNEERDK